MKYQLVYNYRGNCITKYFKTLKGVRNHLKKRINLIKIYGGFSLIDLDSLEEVLLNE